MILGLFVFRRFPFDLAVALSVCVGVSVFLYFVFWALVGYTYDLLLLCNIAFVAVGLLMLYFKGFRGSLRIKAVEKVVVEPEVRKLEPFDLPEKDAADKAVSIRKRAFMPNEKKVFLGGASGLSCFSCSKSLVAGLLSLVVVLALVEEVLLNSALAWFGLALAFLGFVLFPVVGVLVGRREQNVRVVFEVCGLLFATRIVFSPFPLSLLESAAFLPVVYTLIVSAVVLYVWFRRVPLGMVGLSRGLVRLPFQVLLGVSVGVVVGLIENFVLNPQPVSVGPSMVWNVVYLVVTMMVFVGLTEELLFRGLLQSYMVELMPKWMAVHLSALIFALFHIGWLNPLEVVFAYGAGVVFGYLLLKTGGLTAPVVAHGVGNILLYVLALVA